MCFLAKKVFTLGNYHIEIYPYISIPENLFAEKEPEVIQYGADFTLSFSRGGEHKKTLKMLQFILPQTAVGDHQPGIWNLDRRVERASTLEDCVYGEPSGVLKIGPEGQEIRKSNYASTTCCIADTPREIYCTPLVNGRVASGSLKAIFANFAIEAYAKPQTIFQGITWGYEFKQHGTSGKELYVFDVNFVEPSYITDFTPYETILRSKGLLKQKDYKIFLG